MAWREQLRGLRRRLQSDHVSPSTGIDVVGRILQDLRAHATRYRDALDAVDLTPFEMRVFSQNGEDGVIAEILARTGTGPRWFVEFGVGAGRQGNCVLLADVYGWSGLFVECDDEDHEQLVAKYATNPGIRTAKSLITPENVEAVFRSNDVPEDLDVLSIDIDGMDYWVWSSVQRFRPRLVVIEYNSSLPADRALVWPPENRDAWDGTSFYGSSLHAFERLAGEKGYQLVHTDLQGINAFFVRDDLVDAVGVAMAPRRTLNIGFVGTKMPLDPLDRRWLDLDESGAATDTSSRP